MENNHSDKTIHQLCDKDPVILSAMEGWPAGRYQLLPQHVGAIQAAYFCQRPLLVRGGPGLGKSQLAQAVASILGWGLISTVVHYNTTVDDLLYSVDHVKRLDEANRADSIVGEMADYIRPGKVWQAIAPSSVKNYSVEPPHNLPGTVLLIDEIDKAQPSLPNALLEVLANGAISCPYLKNTVKADPQHPCFVLITSNDERLLPQAFLRRCAILDIELPDTRELALQWMMNIFKAHYPDKKEQSELAELAQTVAMQVLERRETMEKNDDYLVGTSEFLDMLRTLKKFDKDERSEKLTVFSEHLIDKSQFRAVAGKNHG
ncbi:MAG: MoxR-like ATPase [Phenylobacterium sp.]|jgi:MoxR-like ATPase